MTTAQIELEELSVGADYEKVANRFRPIFEKIAQGAIQREKERILPFEPIQWLKEAKLGAVRIPRAGAYFLKLGTRRVLIIKAL